MVCYRKRLTAHVYRLYSRLFSWEKKTKIDAKTIEKFDNSTIRQFDKCPFREYKYSVLFCFPDTEGVEGLGDTVYSSKAAASHGGAAVFLFCPLFRPPL